MRVVCLLLVLLQLGVPILSQEGSDIDTKDIQDTLDEAVNVAKEKAKLDDETDKRNRNKGTDTNSIDTAEGLLDLFASSDDDGDVKKLAKSASMQLTALQELQSLQKLETFRFGANKRFLKIWRQKFRKQCPTLYTGVACDAMEYYRRADGSCNNFLDPTLGAVFCPQARLIPPMYDDGINEPRARNRLGRPLPGARFISNIVHNVTGNSPRNKRLTMVTMQWGQFIDHEFVSTPLLKGENGANIECCGKSNENRTQCFPIPIPEDDPFFKNKKCMSFVRSAPVPNHDCAPGYREQMNQVTSFIDGSAIYGSTQNATMKLRKKSGGLLLTAASGNMLPKNSDDKCVLDTKLDFCQLAGDFRVNVVPSLGWSHTAFMREHNRIAAELAKLNPHWNDETIFQEARRIIAAILQIINYGEYLPAILNEDTMVKYQLNLKKFGYFKRYRKNINPSITNVFAVAAFRFGHSQIADYQALMSKKYKFTEKIPIEDVYHRPHFLTHDGGSSLDYMTRWLVDDPTPLADGLFEDGVRNKLFLDKKGNSLDLPALNIQRGRDHGIPSYNYWRVYCKLDKGTMGPKGVFILPDHNKEITDKLQDIYSHIDDIDLFTGAMTETLLPDSSVGATFACLLGKQFKRLRKGDRFWHETSDDLLKFTPGQLKELRRISLARVLCDNFKVDTIQPEVFRVPGPNNERVQCDDIPKLDLSKWKSITCSGDNDGGKPNFSKKCRKNKSG